MKYTLLVLISCAVVACTPEGKKPKAQPAPPMPSKTTEVLWDDAGAIQVRLNNTSSVMIEGVIVDSVALKSQLRLAKKTKGDTATVVIHVRGDTEFGMFAAVHESLEALLVEERDSVAQLRFNTIYSNLNDTQKAIIKRKHHLRIIEKMKR